MLIASKVKVQRRGFAYRLAVATVTVLFLCSVTVTVFAVSTHVKVVTVTDGIQTASLMTKSTDPEEIVRESAIRYNANDLIVADGYSPENGGTIVVERAKTLRIVDSDKIVYCIGYGNSTVADTLQTNDIEVGEEDTVDVPLDTTALESMQVSIQRAFPVTVEADGERTKVFTTGATVEEILDEMGIVLGEDDTVSRKLTTQLTSDATIIVSRVEYRNTVEEEEIPFEVETKVTHDLYEGETAVKVEGVVGKKYVEYKEKYVNGEFAEKEVISEDVIQEPCKKVVLAGSMKRPALINFRDGVTPMSKLDVPSHVTLGENGLPTKFVDYLEGEATAYTGDPATSTGRVPMQGHVAVDPREIPYGSELFIASLDGRYIYGYCIAADTGGFIYNSNTLIDLYMDNEQMCDDWGRRDIAVYVISYGNQK